MISAGLPRRAPNLSPQLSRLHDGRLRYGDALRVPRLVFYCVYIACILGANAVVLIPRDSSGELQGNGAFTASWLILLGISVLVFLSLPRLNLANLGVAVLFAIFVVSSSLWSIAPSSTVTYSVLLSGNVFVAYMISCEYSLRQIITLFGRIIVVMSLLGIIAYYAHFSPVYYIDDHDRLNLLGTIPLRGFFPHKIMGSLYAVIGMIATLTTSKNRIRFFAVLVLGLFVILTDSATGLFLFVTAFGVMGYALFAYRRNVPPGPFFFGLAGVSVLGVVVALANWSSLLGLLGRDDTLTGRTTLWTWGLQTWTQRPILGWGFSGYFHSSASDLLSSLIPAFRNYDVPHFHESFIQTAVDLGSIGFVLLVALLAYVLFASYATAWRDKDISGIGAFAIVVILIVAAFTMFLFFNYNHFGTFSLACMFFALRALPRSEVFGGSLLRRTQGV